MALKKVNTNTVKKKPANLESENQRLSPWFEDYQDLFTFKIRPVSEAFIERLAKEIIEWSEKEENLVLGKFLVSKRMQEETFRRWMKKSPILADAHALAKKNIACRREHGGITRKLDPTFAFNSMPIYDSEWKEFFQWKSNLKQDEGNQQKIVVEINDLSKKD